MHLNPPRAKTAKEMGLLQTLAFSYRKHNILQKDALFLQKIFWIHFVSHVLGQRVS